MSQRESVFLGILPNICFIKQCEFWWIHRTIKICWSTGLVVGLNFTCITTLSQVTDSLGRNKGACHWLRLEWVRVHWARKPCQLSMLLVSRSSCPKQLHVILDKVPMQPCPLRCLPLAQTPLPVSFPLPVWPVITDRLDASQHAIPHPSQPGLFLALLLSLCSTLRHNIHWLEGCQGPQKKDRTMPRSALPYSCLSHSVDGSENAALNCVSILLREQLKLSQSKT